MSSFVNRGVKVFAKDDGFVVTQKRSEGRMKRYESAHDLRAWCLSDEEKRRYLIELIQRSSGSEGTYGKYIPVHTLITTMMVMKDNQIEDLEKTLAAYRSLNLTDEQRAQLNEQLNKFGDGKFKEGDSTTVLFRRKDKTCHCPAPFETQELTARICELQEELDRRDKEAKRQISCLEQCIAREKHRVEKVKQSLAAESSRSSGWRSSQGSEHRASDCADSAMRQVEAELSSINALERELSQLRAANRELQALLEAERRKPRDPSHSGAEQEMHAKLEAAQRSEAAMRNRLSTLESFLHSGGSSGSRPACGGPACAQQRRLSEPRQTCAVRRQSVSPARSRCSSRSDSSETCRSRSRSAQQCRPPFVSTPGHGSFQSACDSPEDPRSRSRSDHPCRPPFLSTPSRGAPTEEESECDCREQRRTSSPQRGCRSGRESCRSAATPSDSYGSGCRTRMPAPQDCRSRQEPCRGPVPRDRSFTPSDSFGSDCRTRRPDCQSRQESCRGPTTPSDSFGSSCAYQRSSEDRCSSPAPPDCRSRQDACRSPMTQARTAAPYSFGSTCASSRSSEELCSWPSARLERSCSPAPQCATSSGSSSCGRSSSGKRVVLMSCEDEEVEAPTPVPTPILVPVPVPVPVSVPVPEPGCGPGHGECRMAARQRCDTAPVAASVAVERTRVLSQCGDNHCGARRVLKDGCTPVTCRGRTEPPPVPRPIPPPEPPADSFRIVSETYRSPSPVEPPPEPPAEPSAPVKEKRRMQKFSLLSELPKEKPKRPPSPVPEKPVKQKRPPSPVPEKPVKQKRPPSPVPEKPVKQKRPQSPVPAPEKPKAKKPTNARALSGSFRSQRSRDPSPTPVVTERKSRAETKRPVSRSSSKSPPKRPPTPVRTGTDTLRVPPPVMKDPPPMPVCRRDASPACVVPRMVCATSSARVAPSVCGDRIVVLDASKMVSAKPSCRSPSPSGVERRVPSTNAFCRRQSPMVVTSRAPLGRGQSPVTLDGRAVFEPQNVSNASCRGPSPMTMVYRGPSREPSPAQWNSRSGMHVDSCRAQGGRAPSPRSSMQCRPVEQPALRKSVPFSSAHYDGNIYQQAKWR